MFSLLAWRVRAKRLRHKGLTGAKGQQLPSSAKGWLSAPVVDGGR
jgi:hypothetical protein